MKFGMNLLLWGGELLEDWLPLMESLKRYGFDGVEIPVFNTDLDYAFWSRHLDDLGLERTAVTVRNEEDNPISSDETVRRRGVETTKRVLDCWQTLGATSLGGPYHSAIGIFSGKGPSDDEWNWGVESMRQVAEHAQQADVILGVESLNRFETYLLNSIADTVRFVQQVEHPNCRMIYDTFHANIEEKSIREAVQSCVDVLAEVHISENDRSTPGKGGIRWGDTFDALHEIGYDGWMVIEAFGTALPELAAATKIWRKMYPDELQLARDGLDFIRAQVAERWKIH